MREAVIMKHLFRLQVHIDGQLNERHPHRIWLCPIESGSILKIRSYDVVTLYWRGVCAYAVKFS